jgi:4-hydroxy-tetrahydrodipicolinate synthase
MPERTDGNVLRGVIVAALTPLTVRLVPDLERLVDHCRRLLEQGCDGVLCLGTTGEASSLSMEERLAILDGLGEAGLGERLLVGVGCCAVPDTVRLARRAREIGAAGVLALPPFYYKKVTDAGLFASFAAVIEGVADPGLRLYLYHIPQNTGVPLGPRLVQRLHAAYPENVVGVKDSAGDWSYTETLLRLVPGFQVFSGTEEYLRANLRLGGPGCISATFNVLAPLAAQVYREWAGPQGDRLQARLTLLRRAFSQVPMVPALKAIVARQRRDPAWEHVRPPHVPLGEGATSALLENLRTAGLTIP